MTDTCVGYKSIQLINSLLIQLTNDTNTIGQNVNGVDGTSGSSTCATQLQNDQKDQTKEEMSNKTTLTTDYMSQMNTLYNPNYTKKLLNDLKHINIPSNTHRIIKQLFKPNEVIDFIKLAKEYWPIQAKQGLVSDDIKTKASPIKWINIRGRDKYMINNQPLHLFLSFRNIYDRCKKHGLQLIDSNNNNIAHRPPYTFTNLYNAGEEHGLGFHQDDVDLFSVIVLLTDDYGSGALQIKDNNNNIHSIESNAGDGIILNKGVWHAVPVVKRDNDRISIIIFY